MQQRFVLVFVSLAVATASVAYLDGATRSVAAAGTCSFTTSGTTMTLDADCTTDSTLFIPDGMTLDGASHTITAVDPVAGHFTGAVVANAGAVAHVRNLTVRASGLANVCDAGEDRLRGILFEGASGSIAHNTVLDLHQGPSGCQEGNAIEVRNAPFDGTHPATAAVEVAHNRIQDYQKTGLVANGDVDVQVHHNTIGASATQHELAANALQLGFGATGRVEHNQIAGNQWFGPSDYGATAVLVYFAGGAEIRHNSIGGNADIGIYYFADDGVIDNNRIFDAGEDGGHYDIGLGNWGSGNAVTNNKVRGFDIPYDGVTDGKNKVIPSK